MNTVVRSPRTLNLQSQSVNQFYSFFGFSSASHLIAGNLQKFSCAADPLVMRPTESAIAKYFIETVCFLTVTRPVAILTTGDIRSTIPAPIAVLNGGCVAGTFAKLDVDMGVAEHRQEDGIETSVAHLHVIVAGPDVYAVETAVAKLNGVIAVADHDELVTAVTHLHVVIAISQRDMVAIAVAEMDAVVAAAGDDHVNAVAGLDTVVAAAQHNGVVTIAQLDVVVAIAR